MAQPRMPRVASALLACGLAASVLVGCTGYDWNPAAPPAAGVLANVGTVKVRNLLIVADASKAVLLGAVVPQKADSLVGVTLTPLGVDSKTGSPRMKPSGLGMPAAMPSEIKLLVESSGITPGATASVTLHFSEAGEVTLQVPVIGANHPDFKDAFESAR